MAAVWRFLQPPPGSFFLFGPRGTGKSTWLAQVFPEALRLDLLAPDVLRAYRARPGKSRYPAKGLKAIWEFLRTC